MKTFPHRILVLVSVLSLASARAETHAVTLEEATRKVSRENYFVLQNAEKVYQAKQTIQLARRNLLPKLNLWRIIETPFSARGLLGMVGDVAPFLVPNNWLRVKEEKLFAEATRQAHRAVWANQLLTARGLMMQASLEERLAAGVEASHASLVRIREIARTREALGGLAPGSSRAIEIRVLETEEEMRTLARVTAENRSQLAFMLGFPGNDQVIPSGIRYLAPAESAPLRYEDHERAVLDASPELKQYAALIRAADYVKKSRYFTFLGSSSLSRGTGGGIFDELPMQDGLGFGLGPSVRIVKSQKRILGIQRQAAEETLRKDLRLLVDSYNSDLEARADATERVELAELLSATLEDRLRLGGRVSVDELVRAAEARLAALAYANAVETRLLVNGDRLRRMTFTGEYRNP